MIKTAKHKYKLQTKNFYLHSMNKNMNLRSKFRAISNLYKFYADQVRQIAR